MDPVADDLQRCIALDTPARRIVCLVPSLTELLFTLGAGAAVVAATRYCVEPAAPLRAVPKVGGTKNPDLAAIGALQPDLIIVNVEENRRSDFDELIAGGSTVFVSFVRRVAEMPSLMRRLARLTGTAARGEELASALEDALTAVARRPARRVFCPIWKNPWMSFNAETYADDLLSIAGGYNVCRECTERYPQVDLETIAALQPQVVLLPDEPYVFRARDLASLAPLHQTPAWRAQRVHFVDGKALSWFGARSAAAVGYLKSFLD